MATRTVRLDGTGDYTSVTAACAGAAASDTISITQSGMYTSEAPAPKAGQIIRNDSGGLVVLSEVAGRATYMINIGGNNVQILGGAGKIRLVFSTGYSNLISIISRTGVVVSDVDLAPADDTNLTYAFRWNASSLTVRRLTTSTTCTRLQAQNGSAGACAATYEDCDFGAMGTVSSTTSALGSTGAAGSGSSATLLGCRCTGKLSYMANAGNSLTAESCDTTGAVALVTAAADTTMIALRLCSAPAGAVLRINAGRTVSAAAVNGCVGLTLVDNAGTITTFAGSYNRYATTAVGTTSTTDKVCTPTAELDGTIGMTPRVGGLLHRQIPVGAIATVHPFGAKGNPRHRGGMLDCGARQEQSLRKPRR